MVTISVKNEEGTEITSFRLGWDYADVLDEMEWTFGPRDIGSE